MDDLKERLNALLRFANQLFPEPEVHFMLCVGCGNTADIVGCHPEDRADFVAALQTEPLTAAFVKPGDLEGN